MKKVLVVTCYFDPDYVRARSLRAALSSLPDVQVVVVKNTHKGLLRYPEMLWRLWRAKRREKPNAYLLTFRGQEILPFVLWLAGKTPVWFDEFIVPLAYATSEPHAVSLSMRVKHFLGRASAPLYRRWLERCAIIFADTHAHAKLSASLNNIPLDKYVSIPVGTDEGVFTVEPVKFTVFYYSTGMQPLHGIPTVLRAAELLKDKPAIEFLIVGGKRQMERLVNASVERGAHIRYKGWIPFDELAPTIRRSGLCLGGPFGTSPQARRVITGKTYQFLACGAPVLVGRNQATNIFIDKDTALVVPRGNARALAKAIEWAYAHPKQLAEIAGRGHDFYEAQFSSQTIAQILEPIAAKI